MPFKKILVATDLSEPANEAIRQADAVARKTGAELLALHVAPELIRSNPLFPQTNWRDAIELPVIMERAAEALVQRVCEVTGREEDAFTAVVDRGGPDTCILRQADQLGVDLVVVGSQGQTTLGGLVTGSVAKRVLRYASTAVLVARPSPAEGVVLSATDFSDPSLPAVEAGAEQARLRDAEFALVHGLGVGPAATADVLGGGAFAGADKAIDAAKAWADQRLAEAMASVNMQGRRFVVTGLPEDEVVRLASQLPAQLVVVGAQGHSGLANVALGSVAESVAMEAPCSVLIVRFRNEPYTGQEPAPPPPRT